MGLYYSVEYYGEFFFYCVILKLENQQCMVLNVKFKFL